MSASQGQPLTYPSVHTRSQLEKEGEGRESMGAMYECSCPNCLRHYCFRLGIGRMFSSVEAVVDDVLTRGQRKQVTPLLGHDGDVTGDYCIEIYRCRKCGELKDHLTFVLRHDGSIVYEAKYRCPNRDCRCRMERVEVCSDELPCPECKGRMLLSEVGMWD
jgi:hypothetical protein